MQKQEYLKTIFVQSLLEFLGNPAPIETFKDFPDGLRTGTSLDPRENMICLVPPPPQPSFFTAKSIL